MSIGVDFSVACVVRRRELAQRSERPQSIVLLESLSELSNLHVSTKPLVRSRSTRLDFDPKALLNEGTVKVARVLVNVIGQDGVGKTCLVKLLLGQKFEEPLSTGGIDMKNAVAITMMN